MSASLSSAAATPATLPDTLPLFPLLNSVLLPRAKLPLNVFELRYMAMVDDALGQPGRMIGMIQPTAPEGQGGHAPPLYKIGCAGRISSFSETEDGRYMIALSGVCRFEVAEEYPMERPYRRVRPDWKRFLADLEPPKKTEIDRKRLMTALHAYFRQQSIDTDWPAVESAPDEPLVSSLVMMCPLESNERQALLEAPDLAARAGLLVALLEMAALPQGADGDGAARH